MDAAIDGSTDYTRFRKRADTIDSVIVICPKCGRKGAEHQRDGVTRIVHHRFRRAGDYFWCADDFCTVSGDGGE